MIYLDNNATTFMPKIVIESMIKWMNKGNPSSSYKAAVSSREMMFSFKKYIAQICGFNLNDWEIIFNSCSTEGNSFIINAVVNSYFLYKNNTGSISPTLGMKSAERVSPLEQRVCKFPHIIASEIEHKSILLALDQLKKYRNIEYTLVKPNKLGFITAESVKKEIRSNTCLITIMAANNETGSIMDIVGISKISHDAGIPFHTDAAQYFGKYIMSFPVLPAKMSSSPPVSMASPGFASMIAERASSAFEKKIPEDVDSFVVSFHKIHGPPGSGFIAIKKEFLKLYDLGPQIYGTQNEGLRGGTENIPAIAGSMTALKFTLNERAAKNKFLLECKEYTMKLLANTGIPCLTLEEYIQRGNPAALPTMEIVFISGLNPTRWLPNTLLISIIKNSPSKPEMCNTEIKNRLAEKNIVISIGSACNTASKYASHVLYAIDADEKMKKGALRISFGDYTSSGSAAEKKK
jgi:cysteine sulfinate desulfinase/cysteine desulfurase-like protein